MKQHITDKFELFVSNAQTIKSGFIWQNTMTKRLAALIYALEGKSIDCEAIKESHALIKNNTGVFSMFKGNMSLCIAAMLSLRNDRDKLFADTMDVYNQLKSAKFYASDYLAVAAYLIASSTDPQNYANAISRSRKFYDGMKKNRWFITGEDDYIFSVMLGLSEINPTSGIKHIEQLYKRLKPEFGMIGNSVQTVAQTLTLGGKSDEAAEHLLILRSALKVHRIKLDKTYTLPALGVLSLLPLDGDTLARDILEAQSYLRAQKGFGSFSILTQELLLHSAAIISCVYAKEMNENMMAAVTTNITSIIIAQQVALMTAVMASSAAGASSSSH